MKSKMERETIIRRAADEQNWEVFSEDPRVIRKLSAVHGPGRPRGEGWLWTVGPTEISFRRRRLVSDSERKRAADRLASYRKPAAKP